LAILHFTESLQNKFEEIIPIVSTSLPESAKEVVENSRLLHYPYKKTRMQKLIFSLFGYDSDKASSITAFKKLFEEYKIGVNDVLFFPGVCYYEIISINNLLKEGYKMPKIIFRFLDIFEFKSVKQTSKVREVVINSLLELKSRLKGNLKMVTETSKYLDFLKGLSLNIDDTLLYPLYNKYQKNVEKKEFNILFPGWQRRTKGFYRILSIMEIFISKYPEAKFVFSFQTPKKRGFFRSKYIERLANVKSARVIPEVLTNSELKLSFINASVVVMPYSAEYYSLRGSAVFMDAINFGVPVVTSKNLGFSSEVEQFSAGILCDDADEAFADSIYQIYKKNPKEIAILAENTKKAYENQFEKKMYLFN
jgi:glycosyltransferase involved in cell wall biosynthesis